MFPAGTATGCPSRSKSTSNLGGKKLQMDAHRRPRRLPQVRPEVLDLQRSQFKRLGVFGRWQDPYPTMSDQYEAVIARDVLFDFSSSGFVYKGSSRCTGACTIAPRWPRPRSSTRSHQPDRLGALRADQRSGDDRSGAGRQSRSTTIIWTTTPWTLPASLAVAFHPEYEYVALENADGRCLHRRRSRWPTQ